MSSHAPDRSQAPPTPAGCPMTLPLLLPRKRSAWATAAGDGHRLRLPLRSAPAEARRRGPCSLGDSAANRPCSATYVTTPVEPDDMLVLARAAPGGGLQTPDADRRPALFSSAEVSASPGRSNNGGCGWSRRPAATRSSSRAAARTSARRARAIVSAGDSGDGPRRPYAADRDRPRRLEGAGPHGVGRRGADRRRGARPPGGRVLLDRLRGDPERRHRGS